MAEITNTPRNTSYDDNSIQTLEWNEHIRRRAGMYIGRLGNGDRQGDGIYVLLKEIIDNSIDEFSMGFGKRIDISIEDRTQAILGFCETIEAAGYTPMIYANTYWFVSQLDLEKLGKYEFWLAAYGTPQFPYHVEAWQYASDGSVPGITGNVDMNVWMR